jgi:hypothetical protein
MRNSGFNSFLNEVTVPGTLRDSLILLGVVLEQQTELQPVRIMTDTGAYSDVVFGLFRLLLGYRFSPRLADTGGGVITQSEGPFVTIIEGPWAGYIPSSLNGRNKTTTTGFNGGRC